MKVSKFSERYISLMFVSPVKRSEGIIVILFSRRERETRLESPEKSWGGRDSKLFVFKYNSVNLVRVGNLDEMVEMWLNPMSK